MRKKATRNSYKRQVITFGLLLFLAIALILTGFVIWIVTRSTTDSLTPNINVGTVIDSALKIDNYHIEGPKDFVFGPAADDFTGRVRWDGKDQCENLKITVKGDISPSQSLGEATIMLNMDDKIRDALIKLSTSKDEGGLGEFIMLPKCFYEAIKLDCKKKRDENGNLIAGVVTFTYEIEFKWGEMFRSTDPTISDPLNPSIYYDIDPEGLKVSDSEVKDNLMLLYETITNAFEEYTNEKGEVIKPTFNVLVTANVN